MGFKVPMTRILSFSYFNGLLKLFGMLIWSSHVVFEIFRLMFYANDLTCDVKRFTFYKIV